MGRWSGSGRDTVEGHKTITTKFLNTHHYFVGEPRGGSLNWTRNGEPTGSVSIEVSTHPGAEYIRFQYHYTETEDKTQYDYKVNLTSINCHYGGRRWFFKCPRCNRRVGVLYMGGGGFACRHCYNLTYSSCNENRRGFFGLCKKVFDTEALEEKLKRRYYRGQPTKKYRRVLAMTSRFPDKAQLDRILS